MGRWQEVGLMGRWGGGGWWWWWWWWHASTQDHPCTPPPPQMEGKAAWPIVSNTLSLKNNISTKRDRMDGLVRMEYGEMLFAGAAVRAEPVVYLEAPVHLVGMEEPNHGNFVAFRKACLGLRGKSKAGGPGGGGPGRR